jgi:hypothetical protein
MLKIALILWNIACVFGLLTGFTFLAGMTPEIPTLNLFQANMSTVPNGVLSWLLMWGLGTLIIVLTTLYFRTGRKLRRLRKWAVSFKARFKALRYYRDQLISLPLRATDLLRRVRPAISQRVKRKVH